MELLEGQDPEKKKLIESSERHKRALEKEVGDMRAKTDKMITNALIIGGSLALTYFVVSSLSSSKKKKRKAKAAAASAATDGNEEEAEDDSPSILGNIGTQVLNQATVLLLDIAKEKLADYLQSRKTRDENS
ncbi:MAG: hypothetical protein K2U26_06005 [Cyclobacteriaceae bacterium]|nr:hypothetical protein [Cyclobacteriaceae bacterium]